MHMIFSYVIKLVSTNIWFLSFQIDDKLTFIKKFKKTNYSRKACVR